MKSKYKIKEDAELYRLGILSGYISRDEVIKWADEIIKNLEAPPYELVEISTSKNINDIISKLKEVRGQYSFNCVFNRFVELLYHTLTKDHSKARDVAHQLFIFMSECEHELSTDIKNSIYHFDDGFDLALKGIYGSVDELTKELLEFLEKERN